MSAIEFKNSRRSALRISTRHKTRSDKKLRFPIAIHVARLQRPRGFELPRQTGGLLNRAISKFIKNYRRLRCAAALVIRNGNCHAVSDRNDSVLIARKRMIRAFEQFESAFLIV